MKRLVVSVKTARELLGEAAEVMEKVRAGKKVAPHYEIAFDDRKKFIRFVENLHVLDDIRTFRPRSVYDLAKKSGVDVSNLNKIILFFEQMGVIRIKAEVVSGRKVRRPIVEYDRVEFKLGA